MIAGYDGVDDVAAAPRHVVLRLLQEGDAPQRVWAAWVLAMRGGVAVLPRRFAGRLAGVVEVQPSQVGALDLGPIPPREIWLVVHRAKQRVPKIRAVMGWLDAVFAERGR